MRYHNALEVDSVCGQALIPPRPPWRVMREPNDFRGHMAGSEGRRHGNQPTNLPTKPSRPWTINQLGWQAALGGQIICIQLLTRELCIQDPPLPSPLHLSSNPLSPERARPETHWVITLKFCAVHEILCINIILCSGAKRFLWYFQRTYRKSWEYSSITWSFMIVEGVRKNATLANFSLSTFFLIHDMYVYHLDSSSQSSALSPVCPTFVKQMELKIS